jgi:hypothetical protein
LNFSRLGRAVGQVALSKERYVVTVLAIIEDYQLSSGNSMIALLLLSVDRQDRRDSKEQAEEPLDLAFR